MEKIEGYALINRKEHYLRTEQTGEKEILVLSSSSSDNAHLWLSERQARYAMKQMTERNNDIWEFVIDDTDIPVDVVKVTKLIHVELLSE